MAKKTKQTKKAANPHAAKASRAKPVKVIKKEPKPAELGKTTKQPKSQRASKPGADTGSAEAQIKFFSERIEELIKHLRAHSKDFDSKRGLLMLIGKRRRMLNYLARSNPAQYEKIAAALKLAKAKS